MARSAACKNLTKGGSVMNRICTIILVFSLFVGLLLTTPVQAYDLPSVNLGFTSFMDGGPPAGPGFYFTQYLQYWTSDEFTDNDGDKLLPSVADEDLSAWISLTEICGPNSTTSRISGSSVV